MRKPKPSKKKIREAHEFGAAGFFKGNGKGEQLKGVKDKVTTVRITTKALIELENKSGMLLVYKFTESNRKKWLDNRPTEVEVGSVDFWNDKIIKCKVIGKPQLKKGQIVIELSKELNSDT